MIDKWLIGVQLLRLPLLFISTVLYCVLKLILKKSTANTTQFKSNGDERLEMKAHSSPHLGDTYPFPRVLFSCILLQIKTIFFKKNYN